MEALQAAASEADPARWNAAAVQVLRNLAWPVGLAGGREISLQAPRVPLKARQPVVHPELQADTVHGVKGKQFLAVLLVLGRAGAGRESILESWQAPRDQEALRVGYVAVTRARRLLVLSPPRGDLAWVGDLTRPRQLDYGTRYHRTSEPRATTTTPAPAAVTAP